MKVPGKPRITLCALAAGIALLSACSSGGSGNAASGSATLNIIGWNPQYAKAWAPVDDAFMKQHPKIKINFQTLNPTNYQQLLNTEFASGSPPDIALDQREWMLPLESAGELVDLSGQSWASKLTGAGKGSAVADGKVYELPFDANFNSYIFYNKNIFSRLHLQPPQTWSQFLAVAAKIKAAGITPIALGGKDQWPLSYIYGNLETDAVHQLDPNFFTELYQGKTTFARSPAWQQIAQWSLKLVSDGIIGKDLMGLTFQDSQNDFIQGKSAMFFESNEGPGKTSFPVGGFIEPFLTASGSPPPDVAASINTAASVAKHGAHVADALKLLNFWAEPANYQKILDGMYPTGGLVGGGLSTLKVTNVPGFDKAGFAALNAGRIVPECEGEFMPSSVFGVTMPTDLGKAYSGSAMTASQLLSDLDNSYSSTKSQLNPTMNC